MPNINKVLTGIIPALCLGGLDERLATNGTDEMV